MRIAAVVLALFIAVPTQMGYQIPLTRDMNWTGDHDFAGDVTYSDTYWDDLRFPPGLLGRGGSAPADVDANMGYLLFASNIDEDIFVQIQMPHSYKLNTALEVHVHWAKSSSAGGDVCWRFSYECADTGETFGNSLSTTVSMEYSVDDADTAYLSAYADADLANPGLTSISGMCIGRLWRDVSGDGGTCADDYAADAILYEFDIHYQIDSPGSRTEGAK